MLRKSVLFKWFLSYCAVMVLPLALMAAFFFQSQNIVRSQAADISRVYVASVMEESDSIITESINSSSLMQQSQAVLQSLPLAYPLNAAGYQRVNEVVNEIQKQSMAQRSCEEILLYHRNLDLILAPGGASGTKEYMHYKFDEETQDRLQRWMAGEPIAALLSLTEKSGAHYLAYILPLMQPQDASQLAGAVIVKSKEVSSTIAGQNVRSRLQVEYAILDEYDNVVFASQGFVLQDDIRKAMDKGEATTEDGRYMVLAEQSNETGKQYVTMISYDEVWGALQLLRIGALLLVLLMILLGGVMIYYILKYNYSPVKRILTRLAPAMEGKQLAVDEFDSIDRVIQDISVEKAQYQSLIQQQNRQLKNNFLRRLLMGEETVGLQYEEALDTYGIVFTGDLFVVILFYLEDVSALFEGESNINEQEMHRTVQFILQNVTEELAAEKNRGYLVDTGQMPALVVSVSSESETRQVFEELARYTVDLMKQEFGVLCSASVSTLQRSYKGIAIAYQQALSAMELKLVLGSNMVILAEEEKEPPAGSYLFSLERQQRLINYINSGDEKEALALTNHIMGNAVKANSMEMLRFLLMDFAATLTKLSDETDEVTKQALEEMRCRLVNMETVAGARTDLEQGIRVLCYYNGTRNNQKIRTRVIQFVQEHYQDPALSVGAIAEQLGIYYSYLSSAFKEQHGGGILDYINSYRVEKAKELMKQHPGITVDAMAAQVGYTNVKTFSRCFKKQTGITPAQFRDAARK